jgi:sterol desaturase/sphingolipid hydroxylase (fatty acid hydroxylase superfamily)
LPGHLSEPVVPDNRRGRPRPAELTVAGLGENMQPVDAPRILGNAAHEAPAAAPMSPAAVPDRALQRRDRSRRLLFGAVGALALGLWALKSGLDPELLAQLKEAYVSTVPKTLRQLIARLADLELWLIAALVFACELRFPAARRQAILSVGLAQDVLWMLTHGAAGLLLLGVYAHYLRGIYHEHLSFMTVTAMADVPMVVRIVVSVLIIDFIWWLRHYIRHKVTILWYFHAVHHSQRELNFLTNLRIHFVESLFDTTVTFLPLLMLQVSMPADLFIAAAVNWNLFIQHGNIRSNFGPLKYFLVTPQAHRIHHSIEERHRDHNFGSLFTIWDRVFGTLHKDYDEYPETGIPDPDFPLEQDRPGVLGMLRTWAAQLIYPFLQTAQYTREQLARL